MSKRVFSLSNAQTYESFRKSKLFYSNKSVVGRIAAIPDADDFFPATVAMFSTMLTGRGHDHLQLQASIICVLMFLIAVVAITQHPAWFG